MTDTPKRVDVESMLDLLIDSSYSDAVLRMPCMSAQTEQLKAALLQQVVELEQSYRESCDITRDWIAANNALSARATAAEAKLTERDATSLSLERENREGWKQATHWRERAEAAERARDEACGLLRDAEAFIGWTGCPDGIRDKVAAFLAANGEK